MDKPAVINDRRRKKFLGVYLKNNWQLYLMLMVPVVFVIIFKYAAYPGLRIAFMDYKPAKGYAGSKWVGLETFEKIFRDKDFSRALKNSLVFNFLDLLTNNYMLPVVALGCVIYAGWFAPKALLQEQLSNGGKLKKRLIQSICFIIKWVAPVAILLILITNLI